MQQKSFLWKHWKIIVLITIAVILMFLGWQFQPEVLIPGIGKIVPPTGNKNDLISSFILVTSDLRTEILNRGTQDIYLYGDQFNNEERSTMNEKRIIPAGYSYFLDTDSLAQWIGINIGMNGEKIVPFDIFLADVNQRKYTMKNMLYIKVVNSKVSIQPQTLSFDKENW